MNKKAAVSSIIADIYAFLVFVVLAAGFFAVLRLGFISGNVEYRIKSGDMLSGAHISLQSYLRAPVQFQGSEITMAELVAWSFNNDDYSALDRTTGKIMVLFDSYEIFVCNATEYDAFERTDTCEHKISNSNYRAFGNTARQRIANLDPDKPDIEMVIHLK
jgi:hypothetical protein